MPGRQQRGVLGLLLLTGATLASPVSASDSCAVCEAAVRRAVKLLPRQPERVVVVDMDATTALLRERMSHTDAFVTTGLRIVYVRRQGRALQDALKGDAFFDHVLAVIIWHEMAHLAGADEPRAQRAEEDLWRQFIVSQKADARRAIPYLALLRQRRHREAGAPADPQSLQANRSGGERRLSEISHATIGLTRP